MRVLRVHQGVVPLSVCVNGVLQGVESFFVFVNGVQQEVEPLSRVCMRCPAGSGTVVCVCPQSPPEEGGGGRRLSVSAESCGKRDRCLCT